MTQLKSRIFKIGKDAPIQFHNVQPSSISCIPDFDTYCSKIAIVNPYSPSCHISQEVFQYFKKIVSLLQSRGFIVYTNAVDDRLPLKNTKRLDCSLQEMLGICAKIPFIVSVRSGLLDFLVKTDIDMFVVFSEGGVIRKDTYSMKDWGCNGTIKEVTYDEIRQDCDMRLFEDFLEMREQKQLI